MSNQIKKELVRLLSIEHGYKRAAELAEVDYAVVRQWAVRGNWKDKTDPSQTVTRAADSLAETFKANGNQTKLGLSEYAKRQAQRLADKGELKDHGAFRNLTAGASQLHGWNEQQGQAQFSLNVLNLGGSVQIGVKADSVDAVAHTRELVDGSETDQP